MTFLVTVVETKEGKAEVKHVGVATTFASAYKNSKMFAGLSEPESGYRRAIHEMNTKGITILVDTAENPKSAVIERIPVLVS